MKKQLHTHILTRNTLRLLLLLLLTAGVNEAVGQEKRYWDFTNWSDATVANLKADAAASESEGWSDVEKLGNNTTGEASKDNCFWAVATPNADGELSANGVVIEELRGLKFNSAYTLSRSLAIAVNYQEAFVQTTERYNGPAYLWLGNNANDCFTIPSVKAGSIIRMGVESHAPNHTSTPARGVELYIGDIKINGPEVPTTYEVQTWLVPEDKGETIDIVVNNTNGCHIYFIEVTDEAPEEIVVGETQVWFRNNEFANRIGDLGNGDFTYTSSNPSIVTFETGINTGIATIKGVGTAIVTATKNGSLQGSYSVRVKKDTWDFAGIATGNKNFGDEWTVWDGVPQLESFLFKGDWKIESTALTLINGSTGSIRIPTLPGQNLEFYAIRSGSTGIDIGVENLTNIYDNNNGNIRVADGSYKSKGGMATDDYAVLTYNNPPDGNTYRFKDFKTYFPCNDISFRSNEYKVSYLPNSSQPGQVATTNNSNFSVYYESLNTSIAAVDPFTGEITVKPNTENQTVKIRAYNLGEIGKYNGTTNGVDKNVYDEYTLQILSQDQLVSDICIKDLLYKDGVTSYNSALDRTIPLYEIKISDGGTGRAAVSESTDGLRLKYSHSMHGKMTISPRYTGGGTVVFNSITITFAEAPVVGETLRINGESYRFISDALTQTFSDIPNITEITLEYGSQGDGIVISEVHIEGRTENSIAVANIIETDKSTPEITFTKELYNIAQGSKLSLSSLVSLNNFCTLSYSLIDNNNGAFSLDNKYLYADEELIGTSILEVFLEKNGYFNSVVKRVSLNVVQSDYAVELDFPDKIKVSATPTIDGFTFNNDKLTPAVKVTKDNGVVPSSLYSVVYSTDNSGLAYIDPSTGSLVIQNGVEGVVNINAVVSPTSGQNEMPVLATSFTMMVLSGVWDFTQYNTTRQNHLKTKGDNGGIYDSDADIWDEGHSSYIRVRDTENFEYILCSGGDINEPLDITRALQSRYNVRLVWQTPAHFYMFGYENCANNEHKEKGIDSHEGGMLKVPAQKGMVMEINGYSNSENAEMLINNDGQSLHTDVKKYSAVTKLDGTQVTTFFIENNSDPNKAAYRFIVTNPSDDGFLYIINSSANLPFQINWIKLTTELLFKFGTETYVTAGSEFENPILNINEGGTFTFRIVSEDVGLCKGIDENGKVSLNENQYGSYTVEVTGNDGELDGIKGKYTVHVVDMTAKNPETRIAADNLEWGTDELKSLITINGRLSEQELETAKNSVEFIEDKKQRGENIRKVSFTGEIGNQVLVIEGVGKVVIQARLGGITHDITFTIIGGALKDKSPVCSNTDTSAEIEVAGMGLDKIEFDTEWMLNNLLGDIRNYRNEGKADELQLIPSGNKVILSRKDGSPFAHGGAVPIKGKFLYEGKPYDLTGMLTIAYTSHEWKFDSNMLIYDHQEYNGVYDFYTDETTKTREGTWNKNSTFDEPTDNPQIPSNRKWKFIRKMGSNNPNTDIIYAYLNSVDGDNAKILPETAGLIINGEKNSDQFGVQMISSRVPVDGKELGLPNIVGLETGDNPSIESKTLGVNDFYMWNGYDYGATKSSNESATDVESHFGESLADGAVVIGTSTVDYRVFADLTSYTKMIFEGTKGTTLRILMNRVKGEEKADDGSLTERKVTIGDDGKGELDLSEFFYVHLNAVKIDWGGSGQITSLKLEKPTVTGYNLQNVMLRVGGELTVPHVKPGQWIEMRWYRHTPDKGERMSLVNLSDVEGTLITETYKIGNTQQGTYMFQVDPKSTEEWLDATFHIIDDVFISIQEVILHEPGWEYESSMNDCLIQTGNDRVVGKQYIIKETEHCITFGERDQQNAPTAPSNWKVRMCGNLDYKVIGEPARNYLGALCDGFWEESSTYRARTKKDIKIKTAVVVKGGWGKVYVTLNSYTSDYKYLANRKTWTITFGKAPDQDYPYTWDFTKYFADTKSWISDDDVLIEYNDTLKDCDSYGTDNPTGSHELRIQTNTWNNGENEETVVTTDYDTEHYESFFVDGAQLVSYGLQGDKNDDTEGKTDDNSKGNGVLPETAGLGFKVKNLGDKNNDNVGILKLDMQSADKKKGYEAQNGDTWRNGKLAIRGGGSIIVPRPKVNDKESTKKAEDFYIYVKSSKEPTKACNTDAKSYEKIAEGLYKYRFADAVEVNNDIESGNVVLDFDGDADVYAIAVTNKFKEMALLSGTGWATESRDTVIDHTLTGYLTTYPTKVYAVVETDDNPLYSDSKNQTVVALKDQRYVVPVNYGLVMKQTENVPMPAQDETTGKATYRVPLFVPAVTTVEDNIGEGEFNLMRANVSETIFDTEKEKKGVSPEDDWKNAVGNDYTRFILASRYMTWKRQDGELTTTEFESGDVAAFYRLHVYSKEEAEKFGKTTKEQLNTLKANTAYLLLRSSKINEALWNSSNGARQYIGIQGVSDMYDDANDLGTGAAQGIYNLSGQKLNPGGELAPGVYIINGKKIIIRRNNGK